MTIADQIQANYGEWIPVTEHLPNFMTPVLVTDGIDVDVAWRYDYPEEHWSDTFFVNDERHITHWMPKPKSQKYLKTGKWIHLRDCSNSGTYCSACYNKIFDEPGPHKKKLTNYCPNCGVKMIGEEYR